MIYANIELEKQEKEFEWGVLQYFALGERGRGRVEISLPTSIKEGEIEWGIHENLTIGTTKNGKPRIDYGDDGCVYFLLSSYGGYTRRGDGRIYIPKQDNEKIEVVATGNGADGAAGRIGTWSVCVLKIRKDCEAIFRVRFSGGNPSEFYLFRDRKVYDGEAEEFVDACDGLGIVCPIPLEKKEGRWVTEPEFWQAV